MNKKPNLYLKFGVTWLLFGCGQSAATNDSATTTAPSSEVSHSSTNSSPGPTSSTPSPSSTTTEQPATDDETSDTTKPSATSEDVDPSSSPEGTSSGGGPTSPPRTDSSDGASSEGDASSDVSATSGDAPSVSSSGATSGPATSDVPVGEDPLGAAATCSSEMYWQRGENDRMRPGEACIACHTAEGEGPRYAIAGTLFPTGHEPNDCNGISGTASGAKVVITDANGQDHELTPNSVGNFFLNGNLAKPYTAKVVSDAGERLMVTPQQDGDCNKCHTAEGASGAPGRVVVPF